MAQGLFNYFGGWRSDFVAYYRFGRVVVCVSSRNVAARKVVFDQGSSSQVGGFFSKVELS